MTELRNLIGQYSKEEISISKFLEEINEHFIKEFDHQYKWAVVFKDEVFDSLEDAVKYFANMPTQAEEDFTIVKTIP